MHVAAGERRESTDEDGRGAVEHLLRALDLEEIDRDLFLGDPGPGQGRLFGGLVAAQSTMAACRSVSEGSIHSLHSYFLRPGRYDRPIRFVVDRIRDGRTFTTRRVVALQGGEAIFNLSASFTTPEEGEEFQAPMPDAPSPEEFIPWHELRAEVSGQPFSQMVHHQAVETRVDPSEGDPGSGNFDGSPRFVWLRAARPLPDDPLLHAAFTVYATDRALVGAVIRPMKARPFRDVVATSLDHSVWFHHAPRFEGWMLYASESPAARVGRGLAHAAMYLADGTRICSVAQEALIRKTRA